MRNDVGKQHGVQVVVVVVVVVGDGVRAIGPMEKEALESGRSWRCSGCSDGRCAWRLPRGSRSRNFWPVERYRGASGACRTLDADNGPATTGTARVL